jgi:predicted ABC-class ATPase
MGMVYSFLRGMESEEKIGATLKKIVRVVTISGTVIFYIAFIGMWIWKADKWNLFTKNEVPTKIRMWLEVEIVTVPVALLYILLTAYIYKKEAEKNVKAGKEITDI